MKHSATALFRALVCIGFTLGSFSFADTASEDHRPDEAVVEAPAAPVKPGKGRKPKSATTAGTASTNDRPSQAQVDQWVRQLPKAFDKKFREEYRKSLLSGGGSINVDGSGEESEPRSSDSAITVDLGSDGEKAAAPETMRERLKGSYVLEVPGANTRIVFVERPRTDGQSVSPVPSKKDENGANQNKVPVSQASETPETEAGLPTIIKARSANGSNWDLPAQAPAAKWDTARAERGFRALDTYLTTPPASAEAASRSAPKAEGAAKKEAKEQPWSEQIVYLDDAEEGQEPAAGGRLAGRSLNSEMRQASFNRNETDLGAMAKDTLQSLKQRADRTPLAGILVNLLLMLTGFTLLALMMAKRRRIATAGYPPTAVRNTAAVVRQAEVTTEIVPFTQTYEEPPRRPSSHWTEEEETVTDTAVTAESSLNDDIRVVFDPRLGRWVLKRQDEGRLSAALAELQAGTVVRGTALGSTTPNARYRLSVTNTWIPTNEEEQIIIAVKAHNFRAASR